MDGGHLKLCRVAGAAGTQAPGRASVKRKQGNEQQQPRPSLDRDCRAVGRFVSQQASAWRCKRARSGPPAAVITAPHVSECYYLTRRMVWTIRPCSSSGWVWDRLSWLCFCLQPAIPGLLASRGGVVSNAAAIPHLLSRCGGPGAPRGRSANKTTPTRASSRALLCRPDPAATTRVPAPPHLPRRPLPRRFRRARRWTRWRRRPSGSRTAAPGCWPAPKSTATASPRCSTRRRRSRRRWRSLAAVRTRRACTWVRAARRGAAARRGGGGGRRACCGGRRLGALLQRLGARSSASEFGCGLRWACAAAHRTLLRWPAVARARVAQRPV